MFPMTPATALRLTFQTGILMMNAQLSFSMRLLGTVQPWRIATSPKTGMATERLVALAAPQPRPAAPRRARKS